MLEEIKVFLRSQANLKGTLAYFNITYQDFENMVGDVPAFVEREREIGKALLQKMRFDMAHKNPLILTKLAEEYLQEKENNQTKLFEIKIVK